MEQRLGRRRRPGAMLTGDGGAGGAGAPELHRHGDGILAGQAGGAEAGPRRARGDEQAIKVR